MAGGQERVAAPADQVASQSTKKITRAMELIAASRIVKAQQRRGRGPALQRADHRGDPQPGRGRRRARPSRCSSRATRSTPSPIVVITADRGLAGGYNSNVIRAAERAIAGDAGRRAATPRSSWSARRRQTYFRFRGYDDRRRASSASPTSPTYEDAREIAAVVTAALRVGRVRPGRSSSTPSSSRSARQRVAERQLPAARHRPSSRRRAERRRPDRRLRVRARARARSSSGCCPATSRPGCSPPCSTRRRPSTPPASGP